MYIILILIVLAMLGILAIVLDKETNKLQKNASDELIKFNKNLLKTQTELIKELEDINSKNDNRDKLIEILIRQLAKSREKNTDLENNIEFLISKIDDKKLKELVQDSKQN